MSKIFVIADTHFNHENIIKYCNRPFKNSHEMNEIIIKNWNKVVGENDIVYHLGDFGFGRFDELKSIFNRLNGIKILIMGNHDYRCGIKYYKNIGFKEVYKKEFILDKYILTHFPKTVPNGFINIFGHIHDKDIPKEFNDENHICVSVDKTNFYPIELKKIKGEKLMIKEMKAPKFDRCLWAYNIHEFNPIHYCKSIVDKINELYEELDKIQGRDYNDCKKFYVEVDRGTIEDYDDYDQMIEDEEVENYDQYVKYWKEDYKEESYFYQLTSVRYEDYRCIYINDKLILSADLSETDEYNNYSGYVEFMDFLILKIKKIIEMLKNNTYNSYIKEKLPYNLRYGIIKREDYWNIYPKDEEELLNGITYSEVKYFINKALDKTYLRMNKMNARMYYDFCKLVYKATDYKYEDIPSKELFFKNAISRDRRLMDIDEDSYEDFDKWLDYDKCFSSHQGEIIPGPSFCRIQLFVVKDNNGYYLSTWADVLHGAKEVLKLFNILHLNGIPIEVHGVDNLKDKFLGEDYIRIIPKYKYTYQLPSEYDGNFILDWYHFDENNYKIKDKVIWDEIDDICLK